MLVCAAITVCVLWVLVFASICSTALGMAELAARMYVGADRVVVLVYVFSSLSAFFIARRSREGIALACGFVCLYVFGGIIGGRLDMAA